MAALQPFYLARFKAIRELKGAKCPGEEICTTNKAHGKIASAQGRTLQNFCHDFESRKAELDKRKDERADEETWDLPTPEELEEQDSHYELEEAGEGNLYITDKKGNRQLVRIYPGCPLFPTKPENTPQELMAAVEAAEDLRRFRRRGGVINESDWTVFELACIDAVDEAEDEMQAQINEEAPQAPQRPVGVPGGVAGSKPEALTPAGQHIRPALGQTTKPVEGMNW